MTEYEAVDAAQSLYANAATMFALFLTMLSGYLVAAYLVGKSLNKGQISSINALYIITSVSTLLCMAAFANAAGHYATLAAQARGSMSYASYVPSVIVLVLDLTLMSGGLKFMWDVRHPKTE